MDELNHLHMLKAKHTINLQQLELQAADYGLRPPLELVNHIRGIADEIEKIDRKIQEINAISQPKLEPIAYIQGITQNKPLPLAFANSIMNKSKSDFIDISPEELIKWYNNFESRYEAIHEFSFKYRHKDIKYEGVIENVYVSGNVTVYVLGSVSFMINNENSKILRELKLGMKVRVQGEIVEINRSNIIMFMKAIRFDQT